MRYRLIKPDWANPKKDTFVKEIPGKNIIEGEDYSPEFLEQKNQEGYGIYYFPNHNSVPVPGFLRGSDIDVFNYVFVDMDLKDGVYATKELFIEKVLTFKVKPHKIVMSGNGVHAYWKVKDLDRMEYMNLQLRLLKFFKTDESIWTIMQLMRCTGFYNTKDINNYKLVEEIVNDIPEYSVLDLKMELPELSVEDKRKMDSHVKKLDGLVEVESLEVDSSNIPEKFIALLEVNKKVQKLWGAETGERSEADYALCHVLYEKDFSKKEALTILMNTNKAVSKGIHGKSYAASIVNKVYSEKSEYTVPSAGEKKRSGLTRKMGMPIYGPVYFDCLDHGWRTREVLGLIGGTGVGKTSVTLDIFYHMIKNNVASDDIFIFFSLELGEEEIISHWEALTGGSEELINRLYVVDNQDDEGNSRNLNLQQMFWFIRDIAKSTGKKVAAIAIDHVGIINKTIDITKTPDFGLNGREDLGFGKIKTMSDREITRNIKGIAKQLDCFCVVQSQTTKEKAGEGDVPLGLNAAYGIAQFEWDMDYVMTIWQPLKRVEYKTDLRVTAFQYCKIRKKGKHDKIKIMDPHILAFDLDTKELRNLDEEEFETFCVLNKEATILRKKTEKKEALDYKSTTDINKVRKLIAKGPLREIK